ncbi:MAG: preprotein translocase subunit YajC [Bacteroidales bacterium]|jgi:preprotein translocase subunit YajC|nr:preprotein translocase subunit YajC [Bacteroidales bacterium]
MNNLAFLLLLPQPAGAAGQSNALVTFLPLLLVFVVFYFFMIRPQMKKQKEMANYRSSLKKGDKVVTTGGIYGRVYEVKDNHVMLEVGGDIRLKVDKSALLKDPTADVQN